jgi:hypothetical protein
MKKQKELDRLTKELVKQMTGNEVEDPQEGDYQIAYYYLSKAMDYTRSCETFYCADDDNGVKDANCTKQCDYCIDKQNKQ